jgi:hypothetical protein
MKGQRSYGRGKIIGRINPHLLNETLDQDGGRVGLVDLQIAVEDSALDRGAVAVPAEAFVTGERIL